MVNWELEAEAVQKSCDLQLMPMPLSCLSLSRELFQLRIMQCSDQNNKLLTLNESNSSSCHCLSLGREVFATTRLPIACRDCHPVRNYAMQ